jgi:DNA-binding response OmpR family regulator
MLDHDMIKTDAEPSPTTTVYPAREAVIHVLHVDDDDDFLIISKRFLERQGSFQVETVLSVKEALQKIMKKPYDAIISDYPMFGKSGLDFLKELRDGENDVPFFLFTGERREEIAIEALNHGSDRYFSKNGDSEVLFVELAYAIRETVKAKRAKKR